jgi:hypothetical protein
MLYLNYYFSQIYGYINIFKFMSVGGLLNKTKNIQSSFVSREKSNV